MAAQLEEVAVHVVRGDTEHLGPGLQHEKLGLGPGGGSAGLVGIGLRGRGLHGGSDGSGAARTEAGRGLPRRYRPFGTADQMVEQRPEVLGELPYRVAVEEVGGVADDAGEAIAAVRHGDLDVELRHVVRHRMATHLKTWKAGRERGRILQLEHDREQWVLAEIAFGPKLLHQPFEGDVLVGVGLHRAPPYPGEHVGEAGVARQVGAQNERVDEEADHRLQLDPGPPGDRRPHRHVGLSRAAREQDLEGGQQRHERRHLVGAPQRAYSVGEFCGDLDLDLVAPA